MTNHKLMQQACSVPLHELLASVPADARLVIDDADRMGSRFIPVGRLCHEAATALRERLAQPEQKPMHPEMLRLWEDYFNKCFQYFSEQGPCETTGKQSLQVEPVAWMVYTLDGKSVFVTDNPADFTEQHKALPLYTTPPQEKNSA